MQRELCFNICLLATSHVFNDEITDLPSHTATFIPAMHYMYYMKLNNDYLVGNTVGDTQTRQIFVACPKSLKPHNIAEACISEVWE
jgi:hypothetical protein